MADREFTGFGAGRGVHGGPRRSRLGAIGSRGPLAVLALWGLAGLVVASAAAAAGPSKTARNAPRKPARASYAQSVRAWHAPSPAASAPVDPRGRPLLALASLNTREHLVIAPTSERGGFAASDLDRVAACLREPSSGSQHPIEPRLVDLVYRIQAHFQAQEIRVVSAYRTARGRGSNHSRGRAIDLIVPGTSDAEVAKFARELGFVGVGIYPSSGFIHLDVRARSYFWVDASAPGRRNRERGVFGDLAQRSDAQAQARGEHGTSPFFVGADVDAALRARGLAPPVHEDDDDEDMDVETDAAE